MPTKFGVPENPSSYPANQYNTGRPGPLNPNPELSTRKESLSKTFQPALGYYYNRGGYSNGAGMTGMKYSNTDARVDPELSQMPFENAGNTYYQPKYKKSQQIDVSAYGIQTNHDAPKKDEVPVPNSKAQTEAPKSTSETVPEFYMQYAPNV